MSPKYKDCKKIKAKKYQRGNAGIGFLFPISLLLIVVFVLGGIYNLGLINYKTTAGYRLSKLEAEMAELKEENEKMEVKVIELSQITRIESQASELNMEPSGEVAYLEVVENEVAFLNSK